MIFISWFQNFETEDQDMVNEGVVQGSSLLVETQLASYRCKKAVILQCVVFLGKTLNSHVATLLPRIYGFQKT